MNIEMGQEARPCAEDTANMPRAVFSSACYLVDGLAELKQKKQNPKMQRLSGQS